MQQKSWPIAPATLGAILLALQRRIEPKNSRSKKDLQNAVFANGLFPIFGPKPGQNNFFKIFSKKVLTNNLRCGNIVFVADRAIA